MEIQLYQQCPACKGTGVRIYNATPNGPLIEENPCLECGGDGRAPASFTFESDWFDDMKDKIDYVYSKTDNIINKLNDIKDKCNQIWDKLNE